MAAAVREPEKANPSAPAKTVSPTGPRTQAVTLLAPEAGEPDLSYLIHKGTSMRKVWSFLVFDPLATIFAKDILDGKYNSLEDEAYAIRGHGILQELNTTCFQLIQGGTLGGMMSLTCAYPGKAWVFCNVGERMVSYLIFSLIGLNVFGFGNIFQCYDTDALIKDKTYFLFYFFRYNILWLVFMIIVSEATGCKESLHTLYVAAAPLILLGLCPLDGQMQLALGNPKPWGKPIITRAFIEGYFICVWGCTGAVALFVYYLFDNMYFQFGNLPGMELNSQWIILTRPYVLLFARRSFCRMWTSCNNWLSFPYQQFRSLGHIHMDGGMVTAMVAALNQTWASVAMFLVADWLAFFFFRLIGFAEFGNDHPTLGPFLRKFRVVVRKGKILPFPGQSDALVRAYDFALEASAVTSGCFMVATVYPFANAGVQGFPMLLKFLFPSGRRSVYYTLTLLASYSIQDRVAMKLIRAVVGSDEVQFSRYFGGKFYKKASVMMNMCCVGPSLWLSQMLVFLGYLLESEKLGNFGK